MFQTKEKVEVKRYFFTKFKVNFCGMLLYFFSLNEREGKIERVGKKAKILFELR